MAIDYGSLLQKHLGTLGRVDTTTVTEEPEEKYKQKFNLSSLLSMALLLLGDEGFQELIGGLFGGGKGSSTGADYGSTYGVNLGSGSSGLGSTTPGGF